MNTSNMNPKRPIAFPIISMIICALNEELNLPYVLPKIPEWVDEILLVDGHSVDKTIEVAKQICPRIKILNQIGKGKGDALKYGVREANGEIIVTIDADGQTNPQDIVEFITPLLHGYDLAKGTRLYNGCPSKMIKYRWLGNKILSTTSNLLYNTKYTDICSGYNAFWKVAFQSLNLTHDGFEMEQEMMVKAKKANLKVTEVNHCDAGRINSNSKVSSIKQGFIDWVLIISYRFRN
jgi:glycosyltransferase involved in cell wall biosynthesis